MKYVKKIDKVIVWTDMHFIISVNNIIFIFFKNYIKNYIQNELWSMTILNNSLNNLPKNFS